MDYYHLVLIFTSVPIITLLIRIFYLIYQIFSTEPRFHLKECELRTLFCVGSGGHTAELLRLVEKLDYQKYQPRIYVLADSDHNSEVKIHNIESKSTNYSLCRIPRSRNVSQSYISSVFSTLRATIHSIPIVFKNKPNVIFCNGPGTCVPICVVAFIFRCLFIIDCRIVFIESICRVRTLSLTGKLLQFFVDVIVVQWPQLRDVCFRAKYFGRLT